MMTLAEFLLRQIDADESIARLAQEAREGGWPDDAPLWTVIDTGNGAPRGSVEMSPARSLAECEAKRKIVEDCRDTLSEDDPYVMFDPERLMARDFLRHLAIPYAGLPDYPGDGS